MTIQAQLADGRVLEFPDGTDQEVIQRTVKRVLAETPVAAPEEGVIAAGVGGGKRFYAGLETALGSIIDPEAAARRGLARQQEIGAQYAPGASLEKVKQAYEKEGLLSAAGEAVSQVPAALAEQFPNIAATLAAGKAGALAGSAVAPGVGTVIGGLTGAAVPSLLQLYGSNLIRQEQETPGQISRAAAFGTAIPGAAAEVASTAIPLGRTFIGKILGPEAEKLLARGTSASVEKAARESIAGTLARGTATGVLAEIPTEVTQQMLERLQAGLPLTTPEALAEYGEAAYGAGLVGAPFGAAARAAGRPGARQEYAALKAQEDAAAFEADKAAALAKRQEELAAEQAIIDRTKEQMGIPDVLALPAPAEIAEPERKVDLQNPIGNITRDELAPEVLKYVDKYRKDMGMPRLQSFSVEDIRDAMTNVNPEGEQAALDSILVSKTGYTGQETFTPDDVINAAVSKNIAPETKGFADFLERATGKRDLETMTQPQLYAAFKSLTDLQQTIPGEQIVLPEGSNASRFTQKQYDRAIKYVNTSFEEFNNQPLAREVVSEELMEAAGLESQRAADMLLDAALKNGDLSESRKQVFRTINPKTGKVEFTYYTREKAEAAAKKQRLDVQEQTLVTIGPKEAPKPSPRAPLPAGYDITEQEFKAGERPAGYAITPEGRMKPLVTILEEQDVPGKIERLQGLRRREADKMIQDAAKHEETLKKGRAALESMEARGETDTDAYKKAQAKQARAEDILNRRVDRIIERVNEYTAPLQAKPVGKKQVTRKGFTVTKDGKTVGTFPTRAEAEQSILTQLSDKELQDIADSAKQGPLVSRAQAELESRQKPGIRVKKSPKTEEQIKAEAAEKAEREARDERVKKLEELLLPMLSKFGLKDVALKIVDNIENGAGGSYFQKLIKISLEEGKPIQTLRHESIHALKELGFFTPQQWKALEQQARKTWVDKYLKGQMTELDGKVMTRFDAYKKLGLSEAALLEEAIADAFGDFDATKPPPGMMAALFKRLQEFFAALKRALTGAGFESAEDIFGKIEAGKLAKQAEAMDAATEKFSLGKPSEANAWKADEATIKAADKFEEDNGIRPYVSEGFLDLPTEAPKYSLQKYNPEKHLKFDPTLGVPINKDGTVTLYYHTTKQGALNIGQSKVIPSEGRNRVYLTNESGGADILRDRGNFDQELDGSTVLVYVTPDMLQVDNEYENGRRDFFIPLAQGDFFNKKMKMQSIQKGRQEAITGEFSYDDHEKRITKAVEAYKAATPAERKKMVSAARKLLKKEHNVGSLLSENGKLEKTRIGEYGLDYEGNSVASQGLGLASAQKITDKVSTCPRSAICEGLCLGETSGGNFMFGGAAAEDVGDIQKSAFRAGARMMQYLKTEALIINPEAFATLLQGEIDSLKNWSASPTQIKINKETKKREKVEKEIYQPAVRLNVTSDFKPDMFRGVIEGNPDVQFYDYTKLGSETIAPNHHLTYSSTGFGQIVDGEKVFFKTKTGQYDHNWATMRDRRLNNGQNVAMAFSSKSELPKFLVDEETGIQYRVWDGDDYDARFLDPKQPDGRGMIIGLRNKAGNLSEKNATKKTGGFFVQYDPKKDGDTVVVPNQAQFKGPARKVIPLAKEEKLSLRTYFPSAEEAEAAAYAKAPPETREFKLFQGASKLVEEGRAVPMFHGSPDIFTQFRDNKPIFVSPSAEEAYRYGGIRATLEAVKDRAEEKDVKVYPLWVRAETPFDYANPDHVRQVVSWIKNEIGATVLPIGREMLKVKDLATVLKEGNWRTIESGDVQDALKALGFDSFYVKEGGQKNLAVYSPSQVKSITGNIGEFGPSGDIRFSLARYTPERIDRLVDEFGYTDGRTKAYVASINPADFVYATTGSEKSAREIYDEATALDVEELARESQTPYLYVDTSGKDWQIVGHEGRHRMAALDRAGVTDAPVVLIMYKDGGRAPAMYKPKAKADLGGQDFGDDIGRGEWSVVKDLTPVSYQYKADLTQKFGGAAPVKFSLPRVDTPQFKKWFGDSKVVDADGKPMVVYHYTAAPEDFSEFGTNQNVELGSHFGTKEQILDIDDKDTYNAIPRVIPVYLSIQNPIRLRDEGGFQPSRVLRQLDDMGLLTDKQYNALATATEQKANSKIKELLIKAGYDGVVYLNRREGYGRSAVAWGDAQLFGSRWTDKEWLQKHPEGKDSYIAFRPEQIKSAISNVGTFDAAKKNIRYSLPRVDPKISERVDEVTTAREQKGFFERMTDAIAPSSFTSLRQAFLNRYEQLGRYDKLLAQKMGGEALLADQSAESAALFSDLAAGVSASAMGYGDRHGGIPVYKGGATLINRDVKGLVPSLAPLAKYGDPKVYQYYQFWAGAKRGKRLDAEGREKLYTKDDYEYAAILEKQFPEFVEVQKDLITFNNGIVKFLVDTQVLSPEQGAEYTRYADYIPFYRQMDGEDTVGPRIFSSLAGVRPPKKLKGGEAPLSDFLETLVRNTQSSIEAGMKNAAALRAIDVVKKVGDVPGVSLERLNTQESGPTIINVLENGKRVSYKTPDKLLVDAMGSLNMSELPFMGLISGPSNLLRNLVTKDPGFMMANLLRDSLSAYVTSGQNMTPIAGTMSNFAKALARKSAGYEALLDSGVIGGYELSQNAEKSGQDLARDLDRKAGRKDPILLRPFTSLWEALERGTTASDAATRSLVYERVLKETGNEAEALYRALEVMNFNRKGSSPLIRVLTAAVPFFNARLQGLDLFYRASTGNMNTNDAKAIQRKFWTRGATMMALSVMYYMMVADDDEYKKQEQETKDNNWIIPSLGIRIPIPFEVGVLFKTMPERITAYALGNDTGKDLRESALRNFLNTFAFNPIPQTVKPVIEAATNFNFFTMRPIVGQGMGDVDPRFQVGPGTSKIAEIMGKELGLSPMKIDHVIKGYTGTIGTYAVDTTDLIMEQFGTSAKANKRFEQMPVIKRFAVDPEARGTVTAYYELKNAVDTFTRTANLLEKTAKPEEFLAYVQKNAGMLAVKDYVLDLEKEMKDLREMRGLVNSSPMDGKQKQELLVTIGRAEQNLTSNIQTVKKIIASTQ